MLLMKVYFLLHPNAVCKNPVQANSCFKDKVMYSTGNRIILCILWSSIGLLSSSLGSGDCFSAKTIQQLLEGVLDSLDFIQNKT